MATTIKLRRDSAGDWALANPVLGEGEPGYENDTGKFKIGDGISRWLDLKYFVTNDGIPFDATSVAAQSAAALEAHIHSLIPHPVYDDGPSLLLLYQNAKV